MELLQFLKDEGYTVAKFIHKDGKIVRLQLNELLSDDQLFEQLNISPSFVQYFPFERKVHLQCKELNNSLRVNLAKHL